jgi:hypothetical protein
MRFEKLRKFGKKIKEKLKHLDVNHDQEHNYVNQNKVKNVFKLGRLKFWVMVIHLKGLWTH